MLLNCLIFFENAFRIRLRKIFIVASYQVTSYYFNWQESQQLSERSFRDDNCTENVSCIKSVEKDKNLQSTISCRQELPIAFLYLLPTPSLT